MPESAASAHIFEPYCTGKLGLDIGHGGWKFLKEETCIAADMYGGSYTHVGDDPQVLRVDMRNLSMFCDESLSYIHAAHLNEDASYKENREVIIPEWRRVLKKGGVICLNMPDQQKYLEINRKNGTMHTINLAHVEASMSLENWKREVVAHTGPWEVPYEQDNFGDYSWLIILRKI